MKMRLLCIVVVLLTCVQCKQKVNEESQEAIEMESEEKKQEEVDFDAVEYQSTTKHTHAMKTQLYRWYQLYERDITPERIKNQLAILSDSISITSTSGTQKGKEGYPERLKVYEGWKNAHHIRSIKVQSYPDSTLRLQSEIVYQNQQPDGKENKVKIAYDIYGVQNDDQLPEFSAITISPITQLDLTPFEDTYPRNRVLGLMHNWLFNVEAMNGNAEPFRAMLADQFELHFSKDNVVTNWDSFKKWINYAGSAVQQTNHFPENAIVETLGKDRYQLTVDFIWRGKSNEGVAMKAHTLHTWTIVDNIEEPFARIEKMVVDYKVPFTPIEN